MQERELLVVSFGSSFAETRETDIGGVERALGEAYPDFLLRRAFSSPRVIAHMKRKDHEEVDSVSQALARAIDAGVRQIVLQPTYLMRGFEYERLLKILDQSRDRFESVAVGAPLLSDRREADYKSRDMVELAEAIIEDVEMETGHPIGADGGRTALVLMGHGTEHRAHAVYQQFQELFRDLGEDHVYIATVDGEDPRTEIHGLIRELRSAGYTHIILRPLMVVAGDHAINDMAGPQETSWKNLFASAGAFEQIDCQIRGLGRLKKVQEIYRRHARAAMALRT